jgi:MurNAc alpha-1-phosphate uridylyltransferase
MMEHFDPERMDILLMVAPTVTTIGWGNRGDFRLLQDGKLERTGRHEVVPFAYCGVAILKPELFADHPEVFSLNRLFDEAQEAGRLYGLRLDGLFMHVGTPDALVQAEAALRLGVF